MPRTENTGGPTRILSPTPWSSWVWLLAPHPASEVGVRTHFQSLRRAPPLPAFPGVPLLPPLSPGPRRLHERQSYFPTSLVKEPTRAVTPSLLLCMPSPSIWELQKDIFWKPSRMWASKCFSNIKQFHSQNLSSLVSLSVSRKHLPFTLIRDLQCF